jgi:uncharacterized protein YndB with AHSA1/START domain
MKFSLNPATESALHLKRVLKTKPDKVRKAVADPSLLAKWWPPEGTSLGAATWAPATNAAFSVETKPKVGEPQVTHGEFRDVNDQMWTLTWAREGKASIGGTLVTIEFRKVAAGTEIALTHELLPDRAARESVQSEWLGRLERLARHLGA